MVDSSLTRRRAKLAQNIEGAARLAALEWIGHPIVTQAVPPLRRAFVALLAPIDDLLPDQAAITFALNRLFSVAGVHPDGAEYSNPFASFDTARQEAAYEVGVRLVAGLEIVAADLLEAGVPLDPAWAGDLITLGQLLLLDLDLARPPLALIDELNVGPIGTVLRDGGTLERSRVRTSSRADNNLGSYARAISSEQGIARVRTTPGPKPGSRRPPNPRDWALDQFLLRRSKVGLSAQTLRSDAEAQRLYREFRRDHAANLTEQVVRDRLRKARKSR